MLVSMRRWSNDLEEEEEEVASGNDEEFVVENWPVLVDLPLKDCDFL